MKKLRKGFTLMELLIVITVLGALAAMMSISSGEAMSSAKAGTIISNLRNFATAANEFYFDNMNSLYTAGQLSEANLTEIKLYMNLGANTSDVPESKLDNYYVLTADASKAPAEVDWYVGYKFPESGAAGAADAEVIKAKLVNRASNIGLYGSTSETTIPAATFTATDGVVWLKAREASRRGAAAADPDPASDPVIP